MLIVSDRNYASGKPVMKGTRLWVGLIVSNLEEMEIEELEEDFGLTREQIKEAVNYCSNQECSNRCIRYCQGCRKENPRGVEVWKIARDIKKRYHSEFTG